jgi:alpha-ketoglutarate-dependent taurine dioxygenase
MQLLQSVRCADEGGENFMVDARYAAYYLSKIDPRSYEILSTIPVNFLRKQAKFQSSQIVPIIELGPDTGDNYGIKQMRYSYFTYAPHTQVPFERMKDFYLAYNKFSELVRDRRNQYYFLLNAGDCVLYDNYRMFHARTGFKGPRHVRGVYFSTQDVYEKLAQNE